MANVFQTVDWIGPEYLRVLVNSLEISQFFNTDDEEDFRKPYPVGATVRKRLPQRFKVSQGIAWQPQPLDNRSVTITVDQTPGIDFEYNGVEQALSMGRSKDEIRRQFIVPAMKQLAQYIDSACANFAYLNANNTVGILGTDPTDLTFARSARQRLVENAAGSAERGMIVSPSVMNAAIASSIAIFNPASEISKQYREGAIGKYGSFDFYESMSLPRHTAGTWAGAVTVNGANQTGTALNINCTSGDTFKAGDVISIASVKNVNPTTRVSTGSDKQFVITQDFTASGSTGTIYISPGIEGPGATVADGQYQNVDALPANTAALTLWPGTASPNGKSGRINLAMNRDAFALVGVPMELPQAVEDSFQMRDPDSGFSIMYVKQYDNIQQRMTHRMRVLFGLGALYPDNCAVRIASAN